ncbi:rRNA accumulation- protein [Theileria orientalis]|uniref:rRNA accumulation- protein n=1 Tax=Theileria orientalis TaxID=68886 RepID=A0A976M865_THEOR|nr:rRNA accumulation- protein [Theileria orientalis]
MASTYTIILYSALIVVLRVLSLVLLYLLKVHVPYIISKNVFDIYEYIELCRSSNYKSYMRSRPFYYYIIKRIKFVYPNISVKFLMTLFIFIFDVVAAFFIFRIVKNLLESYKRVDEQNIKIFGTVSVKHSRSLPLTIFALYLLNPASVFYNYATNPDGYKYFLLLFSVYSSVFSNKSKYSVKDKEYLKVFGNRLLNFRFPSWMCDLIFVFFVLNSSHNFLSLMFPIIYIRSFHKVKLSDRSIRRDEFIAIMKEFVLSITFVLVVLNFFRFKFTPQLENPYRLLDSNPSIDFSFSWYLNELLPVEFVKGTLLKNHVIGFVFPLPLLVGLRKYPFDYLMIMTCLCILTQPQMSILGITFILIILTVNYQILQRTQPFSKIVGGQTHNTHADAHDSGASNHHSVLICLMDREVHGEPELLLRASDHHTNSHMTALNLAVDNNWGGDDSLSKKELLVRNVIDFCLKAKELYADEIEDMLIVKLDEYFSVNLEDGSEVEIASILVKLHQTCSNNDFSFANDLIANLQKSSDPSVAAHGTFELTQLFSDASSEEDDTPKSKSRGLKLKFKTHLGPKTVTDEDGWTTIL